MGEEKVTNDYPIKERAYYIWPILIFILFGIVVTKWLIIPILKSVIIYGVPVFWSYVGYFLIIWVFYKFCKILWYPIYSILGKWSLLIPLATIIYIFWSVSK
ncbi:MULTISPECIES: hypothetical protein [Vagococcus]|uniref:hypothetical protein n=1 Tax=Vagococcus TaxID=2737 RepID=UPI000B34AFB0|nr:MULTISPECIES: hypothetical protein [Vagococcus]HCM90556.1 hypothetical protein [Vagococcus sp.]